MDDIQRLFAERIGGTDFGTATPVFKFEKIKREKRIAVTRHPELELIDLGVGEPDETADEGIIKTLCEQAGLHENRSYADNGILEFQEAAAGYMDLVYQVRNLNPRDEILHVMGSKSALSMLPEAFINPGDITLMTVPGYPIMGTITKWLGGEVYPLTLKAENNYLPVLKEVPEEVLLRAKLLYLNYPNNPTGSTANEEFFEQMINYARKYQFAIIHDAAYAALTFGDTEPLSFLRIPGAKEVGIEIHSLSKAFQMTGWRLGFACGNAKMISALAAVKDNHDSGQFKAIQHAGIYALEHPELTIKSCIKYQRRHEKLAKVLKEVGFSVNTPNASYYQYTKIPRGTEDGIVFDTAEQFVQYLIHNALISMVPWDEEGNYVRCSVTFAAKDETDEDRVMHEIFSRLSSMKLLF